MDKGIPPLSSLSSTVSYFSFCHFLAVGLAPQDSFFFYLSCILLYYYPHSVFQASQYHHQMTMTRKPEKVVKTVDISYARK
jgi:hypothetical protein